MRPSSRSSETEVSIVHAAIAGRARFKVRALYRCEAFKLQLEQSLSRKEEIEQASASIITGTVLVLFQTRGSVQAIASLIAHLAHEHRGAGEDGPRSVQELPLPALHQQDPLPNCPTHTASYARLRKRLKDLKLLYAHQPQMQEPWHELEAEAVARMLDTSETAGLTAGAAGEKFHQYGPNTLPESASRSRFGILLCQFQSLPVALLGVAAGISVVTGGLSDALVIAGVVAINAVIGFVTECEAERAIESLKSLVHPRAQVVRDGAVFEIDGQEVVPGDLLLLKPGNYVAADARLLEAIHLSIDESALTGESMPVSKSVPTIPILNTPLADRTNMVFMGTLVTGGQGLAVVVATGRYTEIGQLQILVGEAVAPETPMEKQLQRMGNQLVGVSGAVCGLVFLIGLARGQGFLEMLKMSISLAVAAVPEGLPAVATTTLALGIRNMRRQNVLIRRLDAVETLGVVQTMCFDKTGTVTENRMSVQEIHTGMQRVHLKAGRLLVETGELNPATCDELLKLIQVSVLCNESEVCEERGEIILRGSSTENALLQLAMATGVDIPGLRRQYPLLRANYRSENRHFMGTIHGTEDGTILVAFKGSPLEVLDMCAYHLKGGARLPLSEEDRSRIEAENEHMAGEALRVLGFAYALHSDEAAVARENGLTWLGLIGMADPVREGVRELIPRFHEAGIDTIMITGDQTATAYAVGKALNLSGEEPLEILDSTHLANIDGDALRALSERIHIFARVSPASKLEIVQALQRAGRVVAMTGDGINDGPALKAADIGVALGSTGTDMAREVADVVLEEDNLETMILAVSHGRTIYSNIRKALHFLLSTNFSEIMVMFVAGAAGMGYPLSAMQLLWINLLSDIFPGLALALEPPEPDVLQRPPRDPEQPIIRKADFKRITFESAAISASSLGAYAYGISRYGMGAQANAMAFQSLTLGQLLHALSCRSEHHSIYDEESLPPNPALNLALTGSVLLQLLTMIVPGLRNFLGIGRISVLDGVVIGASSLLPLLVNEATKTPSQGGQP